MRKLDKQIRHAIAYDTWWKTNSQVEYDSSKNPYYLDVLFELLIAQDGLCAYTELAVMSRKQVAELKLVFESGKVKKDTKRPEVFIDLEHFDSSDKKARGWNWENLFAVWDGVNKKKRTFEALHGIDTILKPDNLDYQPFELLAYNPKRHAFVPNPKQPKEIQDRVEKMITVLCLNFGTVLGQRRMYLESQIKIANLSGKIPKIHQFPTAFALIIQQQA